MIFTAKRRTSVSERSENLHHGFKLLANTTNKRFVWSERRKYSL
ncbi:MAG TPA: hypothetical protein VKZ42_05390 [Flavobacteriaceae bacterium]|nr:hypothetical protein [Flavobacteriaceae bacterium]